MNIQHRFLDSRVFDEKERERFLHIRGRLFEDYLTRLLRRTFGDARFYDHAELAAVAGGGKSCDGVVHYGNAVILFEFKAALIPVAARTAESPEEYERRVRRTLMESAEQLDCTIAQIEAGKLKDLGLDPFTIRRYIPVTVLMDPVQNPLAYRRWARILQDAGLYANPKVLPFQVLDVTEMEMLEKAVAAGRSVLELMEAKLSDDDTLALSLTNYCHLLRESWVAGHNPHLAERFERVDQDMERYTRSRSRKGSGTAAEAGNQER